MSSVRAVVAAWRKKNKKRKLEIFEQADRIFEFLEWWTEVSQQTKYFSINNKNVIERKKERVRQRVTLKPIYSCYTNFLHRVVSSYFFYESYYKLYHVHVSSTKRRWLTAACVLMVCSFVLFFSYPFRLSFLGRSIFHRCVRKTM